MSIGSWNDTVYHQSIRRCALSPLLVLVGMLIFGAYAQNESTNTEAEIVVGHAETIRSMDPHRHTSVTDWAAHMSMYDPLLIMSSELELVPRLAESWEQPNDNTYIFHLREGVSFHDGSAFDAVDVVYTIERMYDPETASPQLSWWPKELPEMTVLDPHTIELVLAEPNPLFLNALSVTAILPSGAAENPAFFDHPVGTGPFEFSRYVHGSVFEMVRFDDFWGETPGIKKLTYRVIPEPSARVASLLAGDIDLMPDGVPPESLALLESRPEITVQATPTTETRYLVLNNTAEPFSDPRVRRAVWHAIDIPLIAEAIMLGTVDGSRGPMSSRTFGYPEGGLDVPTYDPERARELLAEAGYPDGFETTYLVYANDIYPKDGEVALAIQGQLADVGITVNVVTEEIASAIANVYRDDFAIAKQGCASVTADFAQCAAVHYAEGARNNNTDERLHELLDQSISITDPSLRLELYEEASQRILEGSQNVWLFDVKYSIATGPDLGGLEIHPTRINVLREQVFSPSRGN